MTTAITTSISRINSTTWNPRVICDSSNSSSAENGRDTRIALWKGDITTLSGITAITNATNGQGLGCSQPSHRCIDNVIHSWAGPRLRHECHAVMASRARDMAPGEAIVTGGMAGRKIVAFCGISTGFFAYPARDAAAVAVDAVANRLAGQEDTSITDVIFNTFTEEDHAIYREVLASSAHILFARAGTGISPSPLAAEAHRQPLSLSLSLSSSPSASPLVHSDSLERAKQWPKSADAVI
ncbi:Protein-ADP-ribose hydrolase, partial [Colletotrichum shisoi]